MGDVMDKQVVSGINKHCDITSPFVPSAPIPDSELSQSTIPSTRLACQDSSPAIPGDCCAECCPLAAAAITSAHGVDQSASDYPNATPAYANNLETQSRPNMHRGAGSTILYHPSHSQVNPPISLPPLATFTSASRSTSDSYRPQYSLPPPPPPLSSSENFESYRATNHASFTSLLQVAEAEIARTEPRPDSLWSQNESGNSGAATTSSRASSTSFNSMKLKSIREEIPQNNISGVKRKDPPNSEARCLWATCAAVFPSLDELISHLCKLHVAGRTKGNRCRWDSCHYEKEGSDELITHLCADHLGAEDFQHTCRWKNCDRRYATFDDLTAHLSDLHIGSGKSVYICEWDGCERKGKPFTQRQKVMRHIQTHTGDRPYQCEVCKKRFSESNIMIQHMRTHTGEKPFKCSAPGCSREFTIAGALTIHRRVHSGERPFKCKFEGCEKRFSESSNLTKHMRVHTGERPFKCPVSGCGKTFSRSDQVTRHQRIHQSV
ncbi:uncharacterized protein VTP21DRAFT_4338 [Calcarisporiella thermophila]|uniref:uncharacterized protein n=1 Tax=Calcarisporiella thermophila TaxID=911321 RepID=UPI0037433F06